MQSKNHVYSILLILASLLAACSTGPAIPDEAPTPDYKSTQKEEPEKAETTEETEAKEVPKIPNATGPVATVNGEPVPAQSYNLVINSLLARGVTPDQLVEMKDSIINGVVNDFILQKKVDSMTYPVPDDLFDERLAELKVLVQRASNVPDDQVMDVLAQQLGIKKEDVERQVKQAIQLEIELEKKGYLKPISDEEVKAFYDENPEISNIPELVTARHILLKVPETASEEEWATRKKEAAAIAKTAKKKKTNFAELAKEKSEGPTAQNGGSLGTFPRGFMDPDFEEAVFKLKPGKVSDPVRSKFGWHIILVEKRDPARVVPIKELEKKIRGRLRRAKTSELLVKYIEDQRADDEIVLKPENVELVNVPSNE